MPRPKSQTMYLTRTRPMMRDRKVEAISTMVADRVRVRRQLERVRVRRAHPGSAVT
jgi:hypothetical protein